MSVGGTPPTPVGDRFMDGYMEAMRCVLSSLPFLPREDSAKWMREQVKLRLIEAGFGTVEIDDYGGLICAMH